MRPPPDQTQERIPVAGPRPATGPPAGRHHQPIDDASGAGITILVVIGLCTTGGAFVGNQAELAASGGILGCFIGVVAGFTATYLRYRNL